MDETTGRSPSIDLVYDGCGPNLTRKNTGGIAIGIGSPEDITPAQCRQAAHSNPLAWEEPIKNLKKGTILGAITSENGVAWIRIDNVGEPYAANDGDPQPTLYLAVTLWRPV